MLSFDAWPSPLRVSSGAPTDSSSRAGGFARAPPGDAPSVRLPLRGGRREPGSVTTRYTIPHRSLPSLRRPPAGGSWHVGSVPTQKDAPPSGGFLVRRSHRPVPDSLQRLEGPNAVYDADRG